jgi:hypothetical protein
VISAIDEVPVAFRATMLWLPQHSYYGGGLSDFRRGAHHEEYGGVAIRRTGIRFCRELPDRQAAAVIAANRSEVFDLPEMALLERRVPDQFAHHAGLGQHPIIVADNEAAGRNAAHDPACRFPISRCREENVARRQKHGAAGIGLDHDRGSVRGQLEGANVPLISGHRNDVNGRERGDPPKDRCPLQPGPRTRTIHCRRTA